MKHSVNTHTHIYVLTISHCDSTWQSSQPIVIVSQLAPRVNRNYVRGSWPKPTSPERSDANRTERTEIGSSEPLSLRFLRCDWWAVGGAHSLDLGRTSCRSCGVDEMLVSTGRDFLLGRCGSASLPIAVVLTFNDDIVDVRLFMGWSTSTYRLI